jgi:hypothetical protein
MTRPDSKHYVPIEDRWPLLEHEIRLNGQRATIAGVLNDFATIRQMPDGLSAEFAWITVKHIIENSKGEFHA